MKKKMRKRIVCFMVAAMLAGIIPAGGKGIYSEAKTNISKTKATICTGETLQLKLSGTAKKVKWKSSKKGIATVDKDGLVTGKKQGNCVIKATSAGKNYSCKVTVKALPKKYATVNGKKVKVGGKVKITYKVTAPASVSDVSAHYYFYGSQMQIVTSSEDKMRFKTWVFFNGFDAQELTDEMFKEDAAEFKGMTKGKKPMSAFHQCQSAKAVSCKKGKEFDSFYVKVLAHGNFTFKSTFDVSAKNYTISETVK